MVGKILKWFLIGLTATVVVFIVNTVIFLGILYFSMANMDASVDLGSGYEYWTEDMVIYCRTSITGSEGNREYIPPRVLDYNYDKNHIIVKQSPKGARIDKEPFTECDSLYHFDHGYNYDYYWIIDKKEHRILGPYDYEEFKEKCIEMDVKLKFKNRKL